MNPPFSTPARGIATSVPLRPPATDQVNILVVDDRPEDLLTIESVLVDPRYRIVTARSGRDALLRVLRQDFAMILLDAHMPDMDGFEVATIIKRRERSRYTPIVFLTASGDDLETIWRAYAVGAVDYLTKPIDRDVVRAKVGIFVELFEKDQRIRQQAEALRAAGLRRYRNLAEAIPQIVWTAELDGSLTYCNDRWAQYTGQPVEACLGWGWTAAIHPEDASAHLARWRTALATFDIHEAECRLRGKDGSYRWHLLRAIPERDDHGRPTGWLGTYTDYDDLKRAHAAAEQAIGARDEFLSIASHELRTPLTALQLQLEHLAEILVETGAEAAVRGRVDKAVRQTGRLEKLVGNLLDVSRIMTGKLELELEPLDLAEVVRDVADRFADEARRAGCAIEVRATSALGCWDRLRLEQVVTNLLSNAVKYAPGTIIEVSVQPSSYQGRTSLVVADHGIGIAPDSLRRIFGRFERAAPSRHYGGLGVGLYITRQIVVAHGGAIGVESRLGAGARFTVDLPTSVIEGARS